MSDPIPHSLEAEQGVIGCVLIDPSCIADCVQAFPSATVFYDLRLNTVYEQLLAMHDASEPIDLITLHRRLKDKGTLDQVGGLTYLSSLPDCVPSAANLGYYIEIVKEKFVLRETVRVAQDMASKAQGFTGKDITTLMDGVERDVMGIRGCMVKTGELTMRDLVKKAVAVVEDTFNRKGEISGLPTGFSLLDRYTDGLHPGDMVVIAARPAMGKTTLAMNIASHVAELGNSVGVFSLEMTSLSLTLRLLASKARLNLRNVGAGSLTEAQMSSFTTIAAKVAKTTIHIDDQGGLTIMQLKAKARRMVQRHGVKLLVIDYLQLVRDPDADGRQNEITLVSNGIKSIANELSIPVIVLSQLNRDLEKDKNRRPRLADLRESGAIEQDADLVAMLWKVQSGEKVAVEPDPCQVNLFIAKQRNGVSDVDVPLTFYKSLTRFESASRVL